MAATQQDLEWLRGERTLDELQQRFPEEWRVARARLLTASESGRPGYDRLIAELRPAAAGPRDRTPKWLSRL